MRRLVHSPYAVVVLMAAIVALLPLVLPSTFYMRMAALVFIFAHTKNKHKQQKKTTTGPSPLPLSRRISVYPPGPP